MKYPNNIPEEELKNRVGDDFFGDFDHAEIKGKIDFAVKPRGTVQSDLFECEYYLWAEAKAAATDILVMLTQLVLTVGKAKTFDAVNPPHFLGCFDRAKIAFVPYYDIQEIFAMNDFNWNVAPSNRDTKEFKLVHNRISAIIKGERTCVFDFAKEEKELKEFIKDNFVAGKIDVAKVQINKNNFKYIYDKWVVEVMPTIQAYWPAVKKLGIMDGDFYLADLLSENNKTLKEKLFVLLKTDYYELDRKIDDSGFLRTRRADFIDNQKAHKRFWAKYERPPKEEYWDYITARRDLLVPQDVRERKGAFFTPTQWVAKAHEYLAKTFGEDWQDEYYVWDNSAGTGNLLNGLLNKDNIWASTLDKADVDVMHDRIENGANLWAEQVFQFDFLNDGFLPVSKGGKLPDKLFEIINNPKKRKKLIFLINPPYGEAGTGQGRGHKAGVKESKTLERFSGIISGLALREKYVQFFARIHADIPGCKMAAFVTPKYICGPNMKTFRNFWKAQYLGGFATPATTHDNCSGKYPICLFIWDLTVKNDFPEKVTCDVFNENELSDGVKTFCSYDGKYIIDWLKESYDKKVPIGYLRVNNNDFQHQNDINILSVPTDRDVYSKNVRHITKNNLIYCSIYFSVRHCIEHTWLNHHDQFLYPNNGWKKDKKFQNDCLAYALFHGKNKIKSDEGTNHWIPFTEEEVGSKKRFKSRFMTDFISGKDDTDYGLAEPSAPYGNSDDAYCVVAEPLPLYGSFLDMGGSGGGSMPPKPIKFSREASAVFAAGRELWRYYHSRPKTNPNASFYDIREHFQGRKENGNMNPKSTDEKYNELIGALREKLKILAKNIESKVYEYGFLKV
ncbi:MAG: hypothetical protein LBB74_06150 [Chitinispirillales bacterium]|jgi:hypothetical protein|nr:hypothetical protein [Chitinispirillales bacterium]